MSPQTTARDPELPLLYEDPSTGAETRSIDFKHLAASAILGASVTAAQRCSFWRLGTGSTALQPLQIYLTISHVIRRHSP